MKHLSLIVPDGQSNLSTLACLIGSYEIFTKANEHWVAKGNAQLFRIELAGISDETESMAFSQLSRTYISAPFHKRI
jgi:hypothetical protein